MSLVYDGEAAILHRIVQHLAADAGVQTFLEVTGSDAPALAAAAEALIIEIDGPPIGRRHLALTTPVCDFDSTSGGQYMGSLITSIMVLAPPVPGDSPHDEEIRALGFLAVVRRAASTFRVKPGSRIGSLPPVIMDGSDGLAGWSLSVVTMNLRIMLP